MPATPMVLIILDGFGYSTKSQANAIAQAHTPVWDHLWQTQPKMLLSASGLDVGLPQGQMGNSEVGHLNLGAGRIVYQSLTRISRSLEEGGFADNPAFNRLIQSVHAQGSTLHVFGLLSPGGIHSHEQHIHGLIDVAVHKGLNNIAVHAFLDGRDTPPKSAQSSLIALSSRLAQLGAGRIASITGRYYAMDRDNNWSRIEQAYRCLVTGEAKYQAADAQAGLLAAYARGESDEFVQPTVITQEGAAASMVADGDGIIFMNFRADRARQLTRAFTQESFNEFQRPRPPTLAGFVSLTEYADDLSADVAYPKQTLDQCLGEYLAKLGKRQLRLAETEKYAHVTFFFNGGVEAPFSHEERILIPSKDVATYDLMPQMSAREVTEQLVKAIQAQQHDLIVCNYANGDMVGHTGQFAAAVTAVEVLDQCLSQVVAAVQQTGAKLLITADHGNVEQMQDSASGQAHTAHTLEPVPLVYVGPEKIQFTQPMGRLSDVAPTVLALMDLAIPKPMTGNVLIQQ